MKHSFLTKSYSGVLSILMLMSLCVFETGCTSKQFNGVLASINQQIPAVENLAADLAAVTGQPQVQAITVAIGSALSVNLPVLQNAVNAYLANQSSGTKNAIFAAAQSLLSSISPQVLQANKVLDPQNQASILKTIAGIGALVSGFEIALAPFFNKTAQAKADFMQVQPYIPRSEIDRVAGMYGQTAVFGL